MPEIHEYETVEFYTAGDHRLFSISIDIEAEVNRGHGDKGPRAVKRLRKAVQQEARQMQAELDEDGDIQEGP